MSVFRPAASLVAGLLLVAGLVGQGLAQASPSQLPGGGLDRAAMQLELERLAGICERLGLDYPAEVSRTWLRGERDDQTILYLPTFEPDNKIDVEDPNTAKWLGYFMAARQRYAEHLFQQACQLAAQGDEEAAFRLLWQVLHEDPEHAGASRALGNLVNPLKSTPRLRTGRTPQNDLAWPARSYVLVTTLHFNVYSQADRATSIRFASQLEQVFTLWSQFFYPLWSPPGKLSKALNEPGPQNEFWSGRKKFDIVLLESRNAYLELLGGAQANIGVSVGYYRPASEKSFFYPAESLDVTLYHELTHQLLAEGTRLRVRQDIGSSGSFWMVEGIANYFESLTDHGTYWTLGGWETPELQLIRYRGVRDGYWTARDEFAAGTAPQWQADPNLGLLYTHAAGLMHTLLDGKPTDDARQRTMEALAALYQAETDTVPLLNLLGDTEQAAKETYQDGLIVDDADVAALHASEHSVEELVLSGSQLSPTSWQRLAKQANVTWLDLAFTNISTQQLSSWLDAAGQLKRLSIEGTQLDASILSKINQLPKLEELDLSECPFDNAALAALRGNKTIKTLWLTRTQVTPAAMETLRSMPALTRCDMKGF